MEINKEELEKYIEAIKAVIDNSLFNDLSKCVDSIIKNIPKLSDVFVNPKVHHLSIEKYTTLSKKIIAPSATFQFL